MQGSLEQRVNRIAIQLLSALVVEAAPSVLAHGSGAVQAPAVPAGPPLPLMPGSCAAAPAQGHSGPEASLEPAPKRARPAAGGWHSPAAASGTAVAVPMAQTSTSWALSAANSSAATSSVVAPELLQRAAGVQLRWLGRAATNFPAIITGSNMEESQAT